jgi:hypothetical protein
LKSFQIFENNIPHLGFSLLQNIPALITSLTAHL